ncbi:MAG TPA: glycine--tRNA ligase subunit beta [Casimicrobiaceae bacterium]|nr:glycine--tRNA ligase subunit beta [Casimicrobiaceae bacterium]
MMATDAPHPNPLPGGERAPSASAAGEGEAHTLLVEIVTEELPPKALKSLGSAFADTIVAELARRGVLTDASVAAPYATPRRLATSITDVRSRGLDAEAVDKLMPNKVARDANGAATQALRKKLASLGREHLAFESPRGGEHLYSASDGKADYVYLRRIVPGATLAAALQEALNIAIERLPIPKVMHYAAAGSYYNDVAFVRPAHRLVALHGSDVVPVHALGLDAGRTTSGHRFASRADLAIETANAYAPTLEAEGKVLPSFAARREAVVRGLGKAAQGSRVMAPDALLDEVTGLVEWPAVYAGTFDPAFLAVPQECLILTMQQNQKYFALADAAGALSNRFLVVSNVQTTDPSAIIRGNERVLRARLADAKFFYDQDRRTPLVDRVPRLAGIVYHNKLGTLGRRVERLRFLACGIAPRIGADVALAERAALLAKADLVTDMVGEFPELQGTMGRYYALHDGEAPEVADAIAQHYWPRYAGDALPEAPVAQAVALADKLEALAGLFGIGAVPTGDKDPFGLRRAGLGVLRILIEKRIAIPLGELIGLAFQAFDGVPSAKPVPDALADFLYERLRGHLREQGYTANQIEAVLAQRPQRIDLVPDRLAAVKAFESLPESAALSAANKRIVNILRKSGTETAPDVDERRLTDGAERDLFETLAKLAPDVDRDVENGDYTGALKALATAKPAVDRFFDDVMVMVDDAKLRSNRLALLDRVARTMNRVADISRLAT